MVAQQPHVVVRHGVGDTLLFRDTTTLCLLFLLLSLSLEEGVREPSTQKLALASRELQLFRLLHEEAVRGRDLRGPQACAPTTSGRSGRNRRKRRRA